MYPAFNVGSIPSRNGVAREKSTARGAGRKEQPCETNPAEKLSSSRGAERGDRRGVALDRPHDPFALVVEQRGIEPVEHEDAL